MELIEPLDIRCVHVCTGTPFFALLIRPVTGVYLTGTSPVGSDPLDDDCGGLPDALAWFDPPAWYPEVKSIASPPALSRRRMLLGRDDDDDDDGCPPAFETLFVRRRLMGVFPLVSSTDGEGLTDDLSLGGGGAGSCTASLALL